MLCLNTHKFVEACGKDFQKCTSRSNDIKNDDQIIILPRGGIESFEHIIHTS